MNLAMLVWHGLRHTPTRSGLTAACVAIAFLLYMLLRAISAAFSGGVILGDTPPRLMLDARYSMTDNLPVTHVHKIQQLAGVDAVVNMSWFGGYYQDPEQNFAKAPVDHTSFFKVFPELMVTPDTLARWQESRRSVVVAASIAEQYGWQVGDTIPVRGDIWPRADGSWDWEFELAGVYHIPPGHRLQPWFLLRYDYFNASVTDWVKHQVGWVIVRLTPQANPALVIQAIDGEFENSADPTKTMHEDDYTRQFAAQLGDISTIATMILGAVFFSVLLLTANVATLAYTEKVKDLAVLKTLGFRDRSVSLCVFAETASLCVLGAIAGIGLSFLLQAPLQESLGPLVGQFEITGNHVVQALALAMALSVVIGIHPAAAARYLSIVDALRERT